MEDLNENLNEVAVDVMSFLEDTDLYSKDFTKLSRFFEKADVAKKINGFITQNSKKESSSRSLFYLANHLIRLLGLVASDGKIIIRKDSFEYVQLNPAYAFTNFINECSKVVLASGTLEPTEEFDTLNKYFSEETVIDKHSCCHVINKNNFRGFAVPSYGSQPMDFRFSSRNSEV